VEKIAQFMRNFFVLLGIQQKVSVTLLRFTGNKEFGILQKPEIGVK